MAIDYLNVKFEGRNRRIGKIPGWYMGSKSPHLDWILSCIEKREFRFSSFLDGFAGSSAIGYVMKQLGKAVTSVDMLAFPYQIAMAIIENGSVTVDGADRRIIFASEAQGHFMEENFGNILFRERECRFLDELWAGIQQLDDERKRALCYSAVVMALYKHAAYGQLQIPSKGTASNKYVKEERNKLFSLKWDFIKQLNECNRLVIDNQQQSRALQGDIIELVKDIEADLVYYDPPYGQDAASDYEGTYRMLEYFIEYRKVEKRSTPFIGKSLSGFEQLFKNSQHIPVWIVAYFENEVVPPAKIAELMRNYKKTVEIESKRVKYPSRSGRTRNVYATEVMLFGY